MVISWDFAKEHGENGDFMGLNGYIMVIRDLSNTYGPDIVEMCSQKYAVWCVCVFHNSVSSHLVSS